MNISAKAAIVLLLLPAIFMLAFYVAPMAMLLSASFTNGEGSFSFENYHRALFDAYYIETLIYTLRIALITTVFSILIGYPMAYYITIYVASKTLRRILYILILTPLFTSSIVRAFSWIVILGRNGIFNDALVFLHIVERPVQILYSETAIIIGMTYVLAPFMVLSIAASLQNIDRSLTEAARDLGSSPWSAFMRVALPLSLPGVLAGSLIVFTLSVSSYVTPRVMSGGRSSVTSMLIYDQFMSIFNPGFGAALAVVLLLTTLIIIAVYSALIGHGNRLRRRTP